MEEANAESQLLKMSKIQNNNEGPIIASINLISHSERNQAREV
jgi:hypothetical protein